MKSTPLQRIARSQAPPAVAGIITLLLRDHRAMRVLMAKVKSKRATPAQVFRNFRLLRALVLSHAVSEERSLLEPLLAHPKFEDEAIEGVEEHEIHREVLRGIARMGNSKRRVIRMKSFCEILEHHLDEEQCDLFPRAKKYLALSTRKIIGKKFLDKRRATHRPREKLGVLAQR